MISTPPDDDKYRPKKPSSRAPDDRQRVSDTETPIVTAHRFGGDFVVTGRGSEWITCDPQSIQEAVR